MIEQCEEAGSAVSREDIDYMVEARIEERIEAGLCAVGDLREDSRYEDLDDAALEEVGKSNIICWLLENAVDDLVKEVFDSLPGTND